MRGTVWIYGKNIFKQKTLNNHRHRRKEKSWNNDNNFGFSFAPKSASVTTPGGGFEPPKATSSPQLNTGPRFTSREAIRFNSYNFLFNNSACGTCFCHFFNLNQHFLVQSRTDVEFTSLPWWKEV